MSADIGRALAARARSTAEPLMLRALGSTGVRIFGGRTFNAKGIASGGGAGRTYEVLTTTAAPYDAVRIVLAVGQTPSGTAIPVSVYASAAAVGDPSDATIAGAGWVQATFGGTNGLGGIGTGALPPSAAQDRRAFLLSDLIPIASVARTDGGAYPLLVMRAYLFQTTGATGNVIMLGDGTDSFANWSGHPSGRTWRMLGKTGGYATPGTQSGMTSANSVVENGCPIIGMVYYARGKVVSVAGFGDSITDGRGTYLGEGFGFPACQALSAGGAGVAFEWSDLAWSGQTMGQVRQNVADALATDLRWDAALLPGGSPNDALGTIDAATIQAVRTKAAHAAALLQAKGVAPVLWTWLPTNAAVRVYGASDALRRGLNDDLRGWSRRGAVIADFDAALAGIADGSGQVQMDPAATSDGIHPNDTGNARLARIAATAIRRTIWPVRGALAA